MIWHLTYINNNTYVFLISYYFEGFSWLLINSTLKQSRQGFSQIKKSIYLSIYIIAILLNWIYFGFHDQECMTRLPFI